MTSSKRLRLHVDRFKLFPGDLVAFSKPTLISDTPKLTSSKSVKGYVTHQTTGFVIGIDKFLEHIMVFVTPLMIFGWVRVKEVERVQ